MAGPWCTRLSTRHHALAAAGVIVLVPATLLIMVIMLLYPLEWIRDWQFGAGHDAERLVWGQRGGRVAGGDHTRDRQWRRTCR